MHLNVLFIKTNCYTKYRLRVYALNSLFVTSTKNFQMMPKQNEIVRVGRGRWKSIEKTLENNDFVWYRFRKPENTMQKYSVFVMEIVIAQWSDLFSNSTRKLENKKKTFYHYELTQGSGGKQNNWISIENYHDRLLYVFCGKMKIFKLVHFVCEVILIQINELMRSDLKLLTFIVKLH